MSHTQEPYSKFISSFNFVYKQVAKVSHPTRQHWIVQNCWMEWGLSLYCCYRINLNSFCQPLCGF